MTAPHRQRGVTMVELLLATIVIVVLVALAFAVLSRNRAMARRAKSNEQMTWIWQGMNTYAQGNMRNPYPGVRHAERRIAPMPPWEGECSIDLRAIPPTWNGQPRFGSNMDGGHPAWRYAVLLNGGYFLPETMIHPHEVFGKTPVASGGLVTPRNFSYAMLRLDTHARRAEWQETSNGRAPVLADRMIGTIGSPQSLWTQPGSAAWEGGAVFNDGHVEWVGTTDPATGTAGPIVRGTTYLTGSSVAMDHLFVPDDADADGNTDTNAAMVYATDRDHEKQQ